LRERDGEESNGWDSKTEYGEEKYQLRGFKSKAGAGVTKGGSLCTKGKIWSKKGELLLWGLGICEHKKNIENWRKGGGKTLGNDKPKEKDKDLARTSRKGREKGTM